jgi:hypothetical protein
VAVEGHLVRPRRLGDGLDADGTDPLSLKQVRGRDDDPIAW